jgi:hypothetical protein
MGPVVEAWYLTCKRSAPSSRSASSASRGASTQANAKAAYSKAVSGSKPPKKSLNVMFPYPKEASARDVLICNYSGKRYYYQVSMCLVQQTTTVCLFVKLTTTTTRVPKRGQASCQ